MWRIIQEAERDLQEIMKEVQFKKAIKLLAREKKHIRKQE